MDYKSAGVDVEAGRQFVQRIKSSVESTFRPEVIGGLGGFGGCIRLPEGFSKPVLVAGTDGVGTKLELAQDYHAHFGIGIDLVGMCVNDVITSAALPLFFLDYIATGSLTPEAMTEVIEGIGKACLLSECALLGGETAEMPGFYPKGRYDLAGFCVAVVEEEKLINGKNIQSGDHIIGIPSNGIHSNGFSLVRKVLQMTDVSLKTVFGSDQKPLIEALLEPTALYVQLVKALLLEKVPINGMAHITGGGLPENLPRCLPKGLSAFVDKYSWQRPDIFTWLQETGEIPEVDLWNTFNLGVGFCIIVSPEAVQAALDVCKGNAFEAWDLGRIEEASTGNSRSQIRGIPL